MLPLGTVPLHITSSQIHEIVVFVLPLGTRVDMWQRRSLLRFVAMQSEVKADALRTHELQVAYATEIHKEYCTAVQPLIAEICRGEIKGSLAANEIQVS